MAMVPKTTAVHLVDADLSILVRTGEEKAPPGKVAFHIVRGAESFGGSLSAAEARRIGQAFIHHAMRLDLSAQR